MRLFNKTIDRQLFNQYSLGSDLSKQEVVAKIFNPMGAGTWFILNSDPEDPDYLWAIVDLGYGAEVGSVSRADLETYRGRFGMGFERDLSFDPVNAQELYEGLNKGKYYAKGGNVDNKYNYMVLSRLVSDCDYYLGNGNRAEKHLWAGNVDAQIEEMKRLWNNLPKNAKPEWLTMSDILDYEKKMKKQFADGGGISLTKDFTILKDDFQKREDQPNRVYHTVEGLYKGHWFKAKTDNSFMSGYGSDGINKGGVYQLDVWKGGNPVGRDKSTTGGHVSEDVIAIYWNKWDYRSMKKADKQIVSEIVNLIDEYVTNTKRNMTSVKFADGGFMSDVYADGGSFDDFDGITYAKTKGRNSIDWDKEVREYAGSEYDNLTKQEYEEIVSFLQRDWDRSYSYANGGQVRTFDNSFGKTIIFKEEQIGKFTIGISSGFNNNRHVFIYEGEIGRYGAKGLPKDFTQSPQLSVEFANNFYSNLKRKVEYNQNLTTFQLIKDVKFLFADGGDITNFSDNQLMIMNQNVEVEHHHEELEDILEDEVIVPAWVVSKMTTATQNLSDITHYLDGQKEIKKDRLKQDDDNENNMDMQEIENKEVFEPINVTSGDTTEITKNFTDDAFGNLRGFLNGMNEIELLDDYTFDYKGEKFEVEPIVQTDENGVANAVFAFFDASGQEVGEVMYSRVGGKQKFTANSEFFNWNNTKFEDGGFMNNVYVDGGSVDYDTTYFKVENGFVYPMDSFDLSQKIYGKHYHNLESFSTEEKSIIDLDKRVKKQYEKLRNEYFKTLKEKEYVFVGIGQLSPKEEYVSKIEKTGDEIKIYEKRDDEDGSYLQDMSYNVVVPESFVFKVGRDVRYNVLGLNKGDVYKVIDKFHISTDKTYTFIDYVDRYGEIVLKSFEFPTKPRKKDDFVYISQVSSEGIKILNPEEIGKIISAEYKNYIENNFGDGGSTSSGLDPVKVKVVMAVGLDSAIEFYDADYPIRPYQLLERAVRGGYITLDEINKRVVDSAMETAQDSEDMDEVGSSDFGAYLRDFLDEAGFKVEYVNGRLTREFADGGEINLWKSEPKNKPEKLKTFKSLRAFNAYMTKNAKLFRDEHSKNGTGFYGFEADATQQEVERSLENLIHSDNQYADGGFMTNVYAKGGEVAKGEILGLKKNILGTTDVEMKITGMRKPQRFSVYPIGKDDLDKIITIQSETRIGKIDLSSGRGLMSQSHSNGAYFVHFQMDKLTPFTISESDLEDLKMQIFKTAGDNVGSRGIVSDNSGASGIYADGGETEEGVDLFEDYNNIPPKLQAVLDKYEYAFQDGDYRDLEKALKTVNAIGYTFEYYLDGQAYDLRKIGQKGKSEVEEYAKGGTLKKYIDHDDIESVTLNVNGNFVTFAGKDFLNGANLMEKRGDLSKIATYFPIRDIVKVTLKNGETIKPLNGYWLKKGSEPMGKKNTTPKIDETKFGETYIKKDMRNNWKAETNIDNFNGYDWRLSTVKTYTGNLVSSAQGGKTEATGSKGIKMFIYAMYQDPNHTLEVSKPKRLTDKVVTEQHDKALAKFKKFMETGMFKGGGKISNFDKLSDKVAKQYEGKPVNSKFQEEYGKYYSKSEAKEVGDKVAGKVKAMQSDEKAFGGFFGGATKEKIIKKKYDDIEGKIVISKDGQNYKVIQQVEDKLLVINPNLLGMGIKPFSLNISEIQASSYK